MCGIVGAALVEGDVTPLLIAGLKVLEYRGYDSAGVALCVGDRLVIRRRAGRLETLERDIALAPPARSTTGIGHTRWATHGLAVDHNAHPHGGGQGSVAIVHNGIIENYLELKAELEAEGAKFLSETDSEVLAQLVGRAVDKGASLLDAVLGALRRVKGYYAMAAVSARSPGRIVCARHGPPLAVARGANGTYLASDVLALLAHSRDVVFLEDRDVAELSVDGVHVVGLDGVPLARTSKHVEWDAETVGKGGFAHYMLKEIHEQPDVLARTAFERLRLESGDVELGGEGWDDGQLAGVTRVQVVACGTALHAGYIARYLIEGLAGVPVDLDYASEFRYRGPVLVPGTMALAISQSGETADTLEAVRLARDLGARPVSICNVVSSSLVRESAATILTHAGPEIGVASTKAFVAQLVAAYLLAVRLGRARGSIDAQRGRELLEDLRLLRPQLESLFVKESLAHLVDLADRHRNAKGFLFLGRGINYPIALEGALKLKEISYLHAEGYPAGEMKHGPIALVEPSMTTVVINSYGRVADKVRSNIEQVKSRGGRVISVGSDRLSHQIAEESIPVPTTSEWLSPILNVVPLQLLAYHIANLRGCDIDKPRNLAKSVTVE